MYRLLPLTPQTQESQILIWMWHPHHPPLASTEGEEDSENPGSGWIGRNGKVWFSTNAETTFFSLPTPVTPGPTRYAIARVQNMDSVFNLFFYGVKIGGEGDDPTGNVWTPLWTCRRRPKSVAPCRHGDLWSPPRSSFSLCGAHGGWSC
ncbi:hypothetical protein PO909_019775 [Leuciscus waleckii]